VSGDGRAGATAPTTTTFPLLEAFLSVNTEVSASDPDASGRRYGDVMEDRIRAALQPVMLAAWIDGLTPDQLYDFQLEIEGQPVAAEIRAALTRLGGAHE
jgi:hypothetical protein